jgi:hypothetical protein
MTRKKLRYDVVGFDTSDRKYFRASENAFDEADMMLSSTSHKPDVIVHLTDHKKMKKLYPQVASSELSVTDRGVKPMQIHINAENWDTIPKHLGSEYKSRDQYRIALLSHEFAHAFGHDHVSCACVGCVSDVRQQPSRNLGGCLPTTKVFFNPKSPHSDVNFG